MKRVIQNFIAQNNKLVNLKFLFTLIVMTIFTTFYGQEFKETKDFTITNYKTALNATKNNETKNIELFLLKDDQAIGKLIDLDTSDLDFFMDVTIKVLENPELNNVEKIIKVEFEFLACCFNYESVYFVQTTNNEIIKLQELDYMQCEYATEKTEYIFPNQKFGKPNVILTTESFLNEDQETIDINILNTTIWEEKDAVEEYSYNYKN